MKNLKLSYLVVVLVLLLLNSCEQPSGGSESKGNNVREQLKIEKYLDSIQLQFRGSDSNGVIKDEMNELLKKHFKNAFNRGVLNDLPFTLYEVSKCGSKYYAVMEHSLATKHYKEGLLDDIEIELYCEVDEAVAKSLVEKKLYLVNGKFIEYIGLNNMDKYCAVMLNAPFMGFWNGDVQFGAIAVTADSIASFDPSRL